MTVEVLGIPSSGSSSEQAVHAVPVDAVAFFVVVLFLGVFTNHVLTFTKLPYTAWLLVGSNQPRQRCGTLFLAWWIDKERAC